MNETNKQSWDEAIDGLRRAANEVRDAVGRNSATSGEENAASAQLNADVSRLLQSATDLRAKLSGTFEQQRADVGASFDRERAEQSADQIRASLDELASVAGKLTTEVAAAAGASLKHADPELKTAIRALEDVAGSAAGWVRSVVDPAEKSEGTTRHPERPLEEM